GEGGHLIEAVEALRANRRLMVTGAPGAGKSMLLKYVVMKHVDDELAGFEGLSVVRVELNRLNKADSTIAEAICASMEALGFHNPQAFVTRQMNAGQLLILFDGLDEVSAARRDEVVRQIKDMATVPDSCRFVVTCRTAAYQNDLLDAVDITLEVADFTDVQIRRFLASWEKDWRPGKSVEHLMRTLADRPQIRALASNPLLLTIIAFLYADLGHNLPHSRAEFYKRAVDILLDQWHTEHNRYEAKHKHGVLCALALFNQERVEAEGDRLGMPYGEMRAVIIETVLPSLGLAVEEVDGLIDEIVKRSGLLIATDGGTRYQFSHLTVQEYFAATALGGDPDGLLSRFAARPQRWREVVRLWCGSAHEATKVIDAVHGVDPVAGLEALGDAHAVAPDLCEAIIEGFRSRISEAAGRDDTLAKALGALASEPQGRGRKLYDHLVSSLTAVDAATVEGAAWALSFTNLPVAAEALTAAYGRAGVDRPALSNALLRMGDMAVAALSDLLETSRASGPIEILGRIATPAAVAALLKMIWSDNFGVVPAAAAWELAVLLATPGVERQLAEQSLSVWGLSLGREKWVWTPFDKDENAPLAATAGRIAFLLLWRWQGRNWKRPAAGIADPRIGVPVFLRIARSLPSIPLAAGSFREEALTQRSAEFAPLLDGLPQQNRRVAILAAGDKSPPLEKRWALAATKEGYDGFDSKTLLIYPVAITATVAYAAYQVGTVGWWWAALIIAAYALASLACVLVVDRWQHGMMLHVFTWLVILLLFPSVFNYGKNRDPIDAMELSSGSVGFMVVLSVSAAGFAGSLLPAGIFGATLLCLFLHTLVLVEVISKRYDDSLRGILVLTEANHGAWGQLDRAVLRTRHHGSGGVAASAAGAGPGRG
ncbi:MAG: NACHT domain-containing protein, partial [Magnetospirillum sp.]